MQSNLATEIIEKLKKRIKILIVAVVILSLMCAGLCVVSVRKATTCGDCKEKAIKQTELFIPRKEDGADIMQKRRAKDGKAYNV